jgi:hypothetical protein
MMKKMFLAWIAMFAVTFCAFSSAEAAGIGFFYSQGEKTSDWTSDWSMTTAARLSSKMEHKDFGLVFDTNLAKDRLFNYRLEFGKAEADIKPFFDSAPPSNMKVEGLVMNHDFGFGARVAPFLRIWLGPEIRITWMDGVLASDPLQDLDLFGFGVGGAVGLNFNLPGSVTLGIKGSYVVMNYAGEGQYYDSLLAGYYWRDYDVDQDLALVTVMLMFRTPGDN